MIENADCNNCKHSWKCYKFIFNNFNSLTGKPNGGCNVYENQGAKSIDDNINAFTKSCDVAEDALKEIRMDKRTKGNKSNNPDHSQVSKSKYTDSSTINDGLADQLRLWKEGNK